MGTTPDPVSASSETDNTDSFATKAELSALSTRVDALESKGIAGGAPEPANPGENLSPTPTNPELTPDQPGVEPGDAPATPDPEGDTSVLNAPEAPAPEPSGANVGTNPGTSTDSGQGQSQVETPDPAGATPEPQPTQPANEISELPLYVDVTADKTATWHYTPPFVATNLVTPDGRPLYHYEGDTAGAEATGAKDGTIGVYADDVVIPTPEADQAAN